MRPTGVIWDTSTGISRLDILPTQQGYFTCTISDDSYDVAIFNPNTTTSELVLMLSSDNFNGYFEFELSL